MAVVIGVIGASVADGDLTAAAREVGRLVAVSGATLVCGGLGGVMAAACRGASEAGGLTIGVLPGRERAAANEWVAVAVPTGLGEARNTVVVSCADALIAVGGGYGTLSEIGFARAIGRPVIGYGTWRLERPGAPDDGIIEAASPAEAVAAALREAHGRSSP